MTIKWPSEKLNFENQTYNDDHLDPKTELTELHKLSNFIEELTGLTSIIEKKIASTEELRVEAYKVIESLGLNSQKDYQDLLITYVCSLSLSNEPTLVSWNYVKQISYNSWYIENYLYDTIIYCIENNYCAANSFIDLAKDAISSLSNNGLPSISERKNEARLNNKNYWCREENKLEQLWWGLRHNEMNSYEDESTLLRLLFKLNINEFINQISSSSNPFFIQSVFWSIGTDFKYESWANIVIISPPAFNEDSSWNQSPIFPLLLVTAYNNINNVSHSIPRHNPEQTQITEAKNNITELAKEVVELINKRDDSTPIFKRWSAWLMRNILIENDHDESDIFSSAYLDAVLIDEIGKVLRDEISQSSLPNDAMSWESWSYTALKSHYFQKKYTSKVDVSDFIDLWKVTVNSWNNEEGEKLKNNVKMFIPLSDNIPTVAYCLSYPISQEKNPDELWLNTWINLQSIKDIVEFGYPDGNSKSKYDDSTTAHRILLSFLYFGIGILDFLKGDNNDISRRSGNFLYTSLFEAVNEMREINYFIDRDGIDSLFNQIMMRRIIWNGLVETNSFFTESSSPTIKDTIGRISNDIVDVWRLIQIFNQNNIEPIRVAQILKEASIDLDELDSQMQTLNSLDKSRYPYDDTLVRKIKSETTHLNTF